MRVRVICQMFHFRRMVEKPRSDRVTLYNTFYDLSVSRNLFSKAKMRQFGESGTEGLTGSSNLEKSSENLWMEMVITCYFQFTPLSERMLIQNCPVFKSPGPGAEGSSVRFIIFYRALILIYPTVCFKFHSHLKCLFLKVIPY